MDRIKVIATLKWSYDLLRDVGFTDVLEDLDDCIVMLKMEQRASVEQEPVAWMMPEYGDVLPTSQADGTGIYNIPLYTKPQKYCPLENNAAYEKGFVEGMAKQMHSSVDRAVNAMAKQWVGLTDDEGMAIANWQLSGNHPLRSVIQAIEAKLKEKNT